MVWWRLGYKMKTPETYWSIHFDGHFWTVFKTINNLLNPLNTYSFVGVLSVFTEERLQWTYIATDTTQKKLQPHHKFHIILLWSPSSKAHRIWGMVKLMYREKRVNVWFKLLRVFHPYKCIYIQITKNNISTEYSMLPQLEIEVKSFVAGYINLGFSLPFFVGFNFSFDLFQWLVSHLQHSVDCLHTSLQRHWNQQRRPSSESKKEEIGNLKYLEWHG